jgi:iron(III) transport system substrate-binding protein
VVHSTFLEAVLALTLLTAGCSSPAPRVVLYCAQDQEFAEGILGDFTRRTNLPVAPKYDTEATKSVSLATELTLEAKRPRCDVHWNNEIIGTIRLQRQGIYEPYQSPSANPYPDWAKAADGTWTAFATRFRVLIVNTKLVAEADRPKSLRELTDPKWKGKVAMAKPQFGTTATQAAALFEVLGPDVAKELYRGLKANDVQIEAGNKPVAVGVGDGKYAVGLTDTDDAFEEIASSKPVVVIYPDSAADPTYPNLGTLMIPNTVAVVKGCPNPEGARKLVDFLLSRDVESKLANGPSHQWPLQPLAKFDMPARMMPPDKMKTAKLDWPKAADRWDESQRFLIELFGR